MLYGRNSLRLKNFNYTKPSVYFITICINQRLCLFGEVNDGKLKLNAAGKMIAKVFTNLRKYYKGVVPDTYIVMPNHFHGIIIIEHCVGASLCGRPEQENIIRTSNNRTLFFKNLFVTNKFKDIYFARHHWGRASCIEGCAIDKNGRAPCIEGCAIDKNGRASCIGGCAIFKNGRASTIEVCAIDKNGRASCIEGCAIDKNGRASSITGRAQRPAPTTDQLSLGEIIGRFKSYSTNQYISGVKNNKWKPFYEKLWQRGYYDHIVKDEKELFAIRNYIVNNPLHWKK